MGFCVSYVAACVYTVTSGAENGNREAVFQASLNHTARQANRPASTTPSAARCSASSGAHSVATCMWTRPVPYVTNTRTRGRSAGRSSRASSWAMSAEMWLSLTTTRHRRSTRWAILQPRRGRESPGQCPHRWRTRSGFVGEQPECAYLADGSVRGIESWRDEDDVEEREG